jgi:hypothetical protein
MQKLTLLVFLLFFAPKAMSAQCLSGTYTLGSKGDFENFDSLQQALNDFGVCGPTRILLLPERHLGGLQLLSGMGINQTNTFELTAQNGQKGAVSWEKLVNTPNTPMLNLNGVSGVWVHDLKLSASNEVMNVRAQNCQNLCFERCELKNTLYALWFKNVINARFQDCRIDARSAATYFEGCKDLLLERVELLQPLTFSSDPSFYLIQCHNSRIENSYIYGTAKFYDCHGLDFHHNELHASALPTTFSDGGFWAQACDSMRISNNAFYDKKLVNADLVTFKQTPASQFVHNSLFISTPKAALYVEQSQSQNKFQVLNNIISGGHPNGFPLIVMGDPTAYISDYNCIWSAGNSLIGVGFGSLNQTLAEWQNFFQDLHSTVTKPTFQSKTDLRLKGNPPNLSGKATYLPGLSDYDLDGDLRSPGLADIGADQFTGIATDVRILACNLPTTGCHGLPTVSVKLKNESPDTLRHATIFWKINGDTTLAPYRWRGLLANGETSDWIAVGDFFNYNYNANSLELRVEESRDISLSDNLLTINAFSNRMGGDYTVGGEGADFAQLSDAAKMLASAGVCGPVNLWLRKSAQDPAHFGAIPGSIPARSVSIQPESSGMDGPFLENLDLKNLKNVKFKRLHVGGTCLSDGPNRRIEFAGCLMQGAFTDQSAGDSGMVFNQCRFPQSLVNIDGSPQVNDREWRIENCVFGNNEGPLFNNYAGDLEISFAQGVTLRNCEFLQTANVWLHDLSNGLNVENNRFGAVYGLSVGFSVGTASAPLLIANNFFHFKGLAPFNPAPDLVSLFELKYPYFLHNSVHYSTENSIFDQPVALTINNWENGRFEGNLIKTGGSAQMFDFSTSWFVNVFNHNNYDLGPEGIIPGFESLASWQNLTGLDLQTTKLPVKFEAENDPTGLSNDLHLATDSPNKPLTINLQSGISTDIDGQTRSIVSPAIGADEPGFLPLAGPVWPGDCDADQLVSTLDWLQLGVAIGQNLQGPARTDQSISWSPKYATDWPDSIQSVNGKHLDCDGNGVVTVLDTLAIVQNFGEEHFLVGPAADRSGTVLKIELPAGPYYPGQKLVAPILLGTSEEDFYGLALGFAFSEGAVAPGSFWVDFQNSWLGQNGVNLMVFYKKNPVSGQFPVAVVRKDGQNATGYGQVGVLHFTIGSLADSLKIGVVHAEGILSDGQKKSIAPEPVTPVEITLSLKENPRYGDLRLWPNPGTGQYQLEFPDNSGKLDMMVFDAMGRFVFAQQTSNARATLDLRHLPAGRYRLAVTGEKKWAARWFVLMK